MPICSREHFSQFDPKVPHFSVYYPPVDECHAHERFGQARGSAASPEVVARVRARRDSLRADERRARKPDKAIYLSPTWPVF